MNTARTAPPVATAKPISITRRIEFDAGHRIPDHRSQCRNLHGHRYVLEVTVSGEVKNAPGDPENGMVIDFGALKDILRAEVADPWDHAFLAFRGDAQVVELLAAIPEHKTVLLDAIPTAENLARIAAERIAAALRAHYGDAVRLSHLRLYETPNCWADVSGG
jgi:6-pyruvoyltetrahydropterin/6-carboxytetrahydropterin synthase